MLNSYLRSQNYHQNIQETSTIYVFNVFIVSTLDLASNSIIFAAQVDLRRRIKAGRNLWLSQVETVADRNTFTRNWQPAKCT